VKYSRSGDTIEVMVREARGAPGSRSPISARHPGRLKAEVFEKFGSSRRRRHGPARLTARSLLVRLVSRHQGSVSVTDRDGGGSVFGCFLPALQAPCVVAEEVPSVEDPHAELRDWPLRWKMLVLLVAASALPLRRPRSSPCDNRSVQILATPRAS